MYKGNINLDILPEHIAIVMDGNGRWAKQKGFDRIFGHTNGINTVRQITEAAAEVGIKYLTLYTFSTENWNRPQEEIYGIMIVEEDAHIYSAALDMYRPLHHV